MPQDPFDPFNYAGTTPHQYGTPGPKAEPEKKAEPEGNDGGVFHPPESPPFPNLNRRQFTPLTPFQKKVDTVTGAIQRNQAFRHGGFMLAARYAAGLDPFSLDTGNLYRATAWRNLANDSDHHHQESRLRGPSWGMGYEQYQSQPGPDPDGGD